MKLTPWFPGTVKPVRVGVYKRVYDTTEYSQSNFGYCYWNGHIWSWQATTPTGALRLRHTRSPHQDFPWRGVLK
jgi:hypothetical protein